MNSPKREVQTIMHEIIKRNLTIKSVQLLNSKIKKITLTGKELEGFKSLAPDDSVKVFIKSNSGEEIKRSYTPVRYDAEMGELDLVFFLHGNGPMSRWAINAASGDKVTIGGPKGSRVVPYDFEWYLMIADETGIPSILRRLNEMPSSSRALIFLEVESRELRVELPLQEHMKVVWVYRSQGDNLIKSIDETIFPTGDFFTWVALEHSLSKRVVDELLVHKSAHENWIKSKGYWVQRNG